MTAFLRRLRERVEGEIATVRRYEGDEAVPVRTALRVLQIAEEVHAELADERVSTVEAARRTGWSVDTLQSRAKACIDGGELPDAWAGLKVDRGADGYTFVLGSIPAKNAAAA